MTTKIAKALKEWREAVGLTQYAMSERTGIHRAQIASWESGRHSPTVDSLEKLADFFRVDVIRLMAGPSRLAPANVARSRFFTHKATVTTGSPGFMTIPLYWPPVRPSRDPDGTYSVPASLDGMVAVEVLDRDNSEEWTTTKEWSAAAAWTLATEMGKPEMRLGDVWVGKFGGKPSPGQLALAIKEGDDGLVMEVIGVYDQSFQSLVPPNPQFASYPLEGYTIAFVFHHLVWRDISGGIKR